jgi:PAS domain S-box-containing protein
VGTLLVPLIVAVIVGLLLFQAHTADRLHDAEVAAQEQRALLLAVLSAHQDIETGSRGYVIAGKPAFLDPVRSGETTLRRVGPALRRSYAGKPEELAVFDRLTIISRAKRAFAAETVALRRAGLTQAAEAQITAGRGKALMDAIRSDIAVLLAHEQQLLTSVTSASAQALSVLRLGVFLLLGALLLLLAVAWTALLRTIRTRDRALDELGDVSQRRQAILDGAMDGILMINPSGTIENANPAVERMFGYSLADLQRRDVGMLLASRSPIGEAAQMLQAMDFSENGASGSHEIEMARQDGSVFPAEVAMSVVHLSEGQRYVAVLRDVSERKRIEQLKSEFVSTVSHELRTPLTSIAGSLGLLMASAGKSLEPRSARLVEIAHANANRLVRLINDILDVEKMESGRMPFNNRELDLTTALTSAKEAMSGYASEFDVTLHLDGATEPALVMADHDRLAQVFDNLLSNAIKFSPRAGVVTVELQPGVEWHSISITDQGPGIPAEFQGRIFGKFAQADSSDTRQKGGTGLGLSIVREIMRRLGGRIDFTTEEGKGTTFRLLLPALHQPESRTDGKPMLLACGNGAATEFTGALRAAGYEVRLVESLSELAEVAERTLFDAAVVDMGLPDGTGIAMIRNIRESKRNQATPLLALGGRAGAGGMEGDAALVLDWLHKPEEVTRLVDRVGATLRAGNSTLPRVLHVEDDPDVVSLVTDALEGYASVSTASTVAEARASLARSTFDLVVIDLTLADGSGIALLPDLRSAGGKPIPVVVFSAQDADPVTAGLVDAYLTKSRTPLSSLVAIVSSLTGTNRPRSPE